MALKHFSIKAQLASVVVVLSTVLVAIGASGLLGMSAALSINRQLTEERIPKTVAADNTLIWISRQRTSLDQAAMTNDPAWADSMYAMDANARKEALEWWAKYMALPQTDEGRILVKKVSEDIDAVEQELSRFAEIIKSGDRQAIADQARKVGKIYPAMQRDGQALNRYEAEQANQSQDASASRYEASRTFTIVAIAGGLLLAFFSWVSLRRAIDEPMQRALIHFGAIAAGDLTQPIHVHSKNEMGQLLDGLARMQDSLSQTVRAVRDGSEAIATATREIASGNLDLSSRTEQQAASLEETASSMEELASTVKHNAENARHATTLAINASSIAADGNNVVGRVVQTMEAIRVSSARITDIVSIIDGIAFQTNILALNAAVEAARAGEQGRGFAVVATEVRALAQRSSTAAKEIKELIMHSVERVQAGSALVGQAGDTMSHVIEAVQSVSDIMSAISAASNEQSAGIDQVSRAVTLMDEATQQNAALVEQASAAAKSLEQQAQRLMQEVVIFRLVDTVVLPVTSFSAPKTSPALKHPGHSGAAVALATASKPGSRTSPSNDNSDWETS